MPQMAPINWLFLFIMFIMCFYFFNVLNYYIFEPKIKASEKKKLIKIKMNWKW